MSTSQVDTSRHPILDAAYAERCRSRLDEDGALVLDGFFTDDAIAQVVAESVHRERDAFYTDSTHNVYLTPPDAARPGSHPFNRQVASSKGLIADDQIPTDSPLRDVYNDAGFRAFLCAVLGIGGIHPYADSLSSINTGAKRAQCIRVLGSGNPRTCGVGDVIVAAVKKAIPNSAVKKGEVVRGVIVRTRKAVRRVDGSYVRFDRNAMVIVDTDGNPKGTRIFGAVARELRAKNYMKIVSLASEVV